MTQIKIPRDKRNDRGRLRLAIKMDAGEKRAFRWRKGTGMSVFGTKLSPAIGAYREGAAAADRPEPTVATGSTQPKTYAQSQLSSPYNNSYGPHICD